MKAEHRKELETNVLADRMGRVVQKIRTRPQRRVVLYVVGGVVAVAKHVQHQCVNDGGKALVRRVQQSCRKSR